MKSGFTKILLGIVAFVLTLSVYGIKIYAASGNVSISSANGSKGDTVSVTVSVTTDEAALGEVNISYDTNYLEYTGSSNPGDTSNGVAGLIKIVITDIQPGQGYSVNLNFRLREIGSAAISVQRAALYSQVGGMEPMPYNQSGGNINISTATVASADNRLSGLSVSAVTSNGDSSNVTYTPNFSPDVFEYTAELGSNVTKLVIATTLSDSKSKTKVSGTRIDPGNNKTTITVTAEDGSTSVYTLYTTRAIDTTTEQPSESTSEGETTSESNNPGEFDRTPRKIESINKYIIQDFTLTTIPEGFEEATTTYGGATVAALKGIAKPITVLCLADDAQGTNIAKYIYNELSGELNKMVDITSMQKMYTIIPTDDTYTGPAGYTQTALDINGDIVKAWIKAEGTEFYVVYAMNWNGETSLYVYDTKEQTMQRFVEGNKSETVTDEPEKEDEEYLLLKRKYNETVDKYEADNNKKDKIIILLRGVVVILGLFIIFILGRKRAALKVYQNDMDDEVGDEDHDEDGDIGNEVMSAGKTEDTISDNTDSTKENHYATGNAAVDETEEAITIEETESENTVSTEETGLKEKMASGEKEIWKEENYSEQNNLDITKTEDKKDGKLIDMEEEEPFEIEFVDLDDKK